MTVSDYRKMLKQLKTKPVKLNRFLKHNKPKDRKEDKFGWKPGDLMKGEDAAVINQGS